MSFHTKSGGLPLFRLNFFNSVMRKHGFMEEARVVLNQGSVDA
jgi:hypothetical protein